MLQNSIRHVELSTFITTLKGGTRPEIWKGKDGNYYVVKFTDNPQGVRSVINELFASQIGRAIGLPIPEGVVAYLTSGGHTEWPDGCLPRRDSQLQSRATQGEHFGSLIPYDFATSCAFDYCPSKLTPRIKWLRDMVGCWVFDVWTCNADSTQFLFHTYGRKALRLWKIDHGAAFGGIKWALRDSERLSSHWSATIIGITQSLSHIDRYVARIQSLDIDGLEAMAAAIPRNWLAGQEGAFSHLLEQLARRAEQLPNCVTDLSLTRV